MSQATYIGMNASTGRAITDDAHITQSISDILLTPIGSRVMRREYGSLLFDLIDQPAGNPVTNLRIMSAIYSALHLWEPRIILTSVTLSTDEAGQFIARIQASKVDTQATFSADVALRNTQ